MRTPCTAMVLTAVLASACGGPGPGGTPDLRGGGDLASAAPDMPVPAESNIKHVVVIVQENHTFDSYFGRYCTAAAGSNPACTSGPACCEGAPATDPSGAAPVVLDDAGNAGFDRNHTQACELLEMDGGRMDRYVAGASCSDPRNFAIADAATLAPYFDLVAKSALADRYFQPVVGQSSSNDMYLAVGRFVFLDNSVKPNAVGHGCNLPGSSLMTYQGQSTIADLLLKGGFSFGFYAEGYRAMQQSKLCPAPPSDCTMTPLALPTYPCDYDPSDVPFEYYAQFTDNPLYMKDYLDLATDIAASSLPALSFVKAIGYKQEHPGNGTKISMGETFVEQTIAAVEGSPYADDTLILITWDEGGGFYDHVTPPAQSPVDNQPYGTRVPLIAVGRFARQNWVSHVVMEHASILRFVEWNFLKQVGLLGARDAVVNNIGDLLDPAQTGAVVPKD